MQIDIAGYHSDVGRTYAIDPTPDQQAVYDALGLLTAKGVLRRIQPAGFPALFDSRVGDAHHHAICRACGAIADVEGAPGPRSGSDAAGVHGYVIDEVEIWYRGVCPSCRTAAGTSTTP